MLYRSQFSTNYACRALFRQLMNHIIILVCLPADRACCFPLRILVSPSQGQPLYFSYSPIIFHRFFQKLTQKCHEISIRMFKNSNQIFPTFLQNFFTISLKLERTFSVFFATSAELITMFLHNFPRINPKFIPHFSFIFFKFSRDFVNIFSTLPRDGV